MTREKNYSTPKGRPILTARDRSVCTACRWREYAETTNDFLRHKAGIDPRIVELVILVTAREADCAYVWNAHEPQGLKAGLPKETIDIVRISQADAGVAEKDAADHSTRPRSA